MAVVRITSDDFCPDLFIKPMDNNIFPQVEDGEGDFRESEHFHPHVDSDGEFCLGNAAPQFQTARQELDIYTMLKIASKILSSYNPGSPYVVFEEYRASEDDRDQQLFNLNEQRYQQQQGDNHVEEEQEEQTLGEGGLPYGEQPSEPNVNTTTSVRVELPF